MGLFLLNGAAHAQRMTAFVPSSSEEAKKKLDELGGLTREVILVPDYQTKQPVKAELVGIFYNISDEPIAIRTSSKVVGFGDSRGVPVNTAYYIQTRDGTIQNLSGKYIDDKTLEAAANYAHNYARSKNIKGGEYFLPLHYQNGDIVFSPQEGRSEKVIEMSHKDFKKDGLLDVTSDDGIHSHKLLRSVKPNLPSSDAATKPSEEDLKKKLSDDEKAAGLDKVNDLNLGFYFDLKKLNPEVRKAKIAEDYKRIEMELSNPKIYEGRVKFLNDRKAMLKAAEKIFGTEIKSKAELDSDKEARALFDRPGTGTPNKSELVRNENGSSSPKADNDGSKEDKRKVVCLTCSSGEQ